MSTLHRIGERWRNATARDPRSRLDPENLPRDILGIIRDYTLPHIGFDMRAVPMVHQYSRFVGMFRGELVSWNETIGIYSVHIGGRQIYQSSEEFHDYPIILGDVIIWRTLVLTYTYSDALVERPYSDGEYAFDEDLPTQPIPQPCWHEACCRHEQGYSVRGPCADSTSIRPMRTLGTYDGVEYLEIGNGSVFSTLAAVHPNGSRYYLTNLTKNMRTFPPITYPLIVGRHLLDPSDFSLIGTWPGNGPDPLPCRAQTMHGHVYAVSYYKCTMFRLE